MTVRFAVYLYCNSKKKLVTIIRNLIPVDWALIKRCSLVVSFKITCQQCLSPSVVHPVKRSSWSGVLSQKSLNAPNMIMAPQWEYQIQGKRISDQTVLLNCTLMPHITYRNAMPTFHHWRIKDQRFGLSFGSAYDASKFYNRLQKALEHLCHQSKSSELYSKGTNSSCV
ncbi:unnamed protein product [Anisakis simplex]|uniref:SD10629p (inferred by orthology to a D. melanogaster protein) n=1 Tax=Anisakis simplex TaxID=6269 RepID=A0A0M3J4S9_ANISI|nr:unnamed protein product [Anisakis simplex]